MVKMRERDLKDQVIQLARLTGWLVHHDRPARTKDGWRTAIEGDVGFPDLVLARGGRVIFAELKAETGRVTRQQQEWIDELLGEATVDEPTTHEVYIWRPSDFPEIQKVLAR